MTHNKLLEVQGYRRVRGKLTGDTKLIKNTDQEAEAIAARIMHAMIIIGSTRAQIQPYKSQYPLTTTSYPYTRGGSLSVSQSSKA